MRKIYHTVSLLLITAGVLGAQVNVTVTTPSKVGACIENQYTLSFSGAPALTRLEITPSLNVTAGGSCPATNGIAIQYVNATNATLIADGSSLTVEVSNTGATTISYYVLIDCHFADSSSVNLSQTFTSNNGTDFLAGNSNVYTTTNIKKPNIVLQNTTNFQASYLSDNYFIYYYRNNGDSANIKFNFMADTSGYCKQDSTISIFYSKGLQGTQYAYNGTSGTIILGHLDTLVIKQKVYVSKCITACVADTAGFTWSCNYTAAQASGFCNQCQQNYKYSYHVFNNDSAVADIIRISPVRADREFSCFNDTANVINWKYMILNTGRGAMDSLSFDLMEWGTSGNTALKNYLMLIDSSSVSVSKGITNGCTLTTNLTMRSQWLCKDLVPAALYKAEVRVKNFGEKDTLFVSFTTMRCSEEDNAALLNKPKIYNQWYFSNFKAREICGTAVNFPSATGLFGTFISGQMTGTAYDDINLKLQYFPSVSNLSVDNSGMGDSAEFSMDFKGLVRKSAVNIYQLLGCDTVQSRCDTLYGWLRATVFCDTNIRITRPWQDVYFIKTDANNDTVIFNPEYYYTSNPIGNTVCRRTSYYFYFNLADSGMRSVLDSGKFIFKIQACCGSDLSPSPYSATFHLLPNPGNCFALNYTGAAFATHLVPPDIIHNKGTVQWLPLSERGKEIYVLCPGCKSPGIIAHSYRMQRAESSLGLLDSDNDGRADEPLTQITDTSGWYLQYGNYLNRNISSFGDRTEDFLLSNFVDGDKSTGGYDYGQLQQLGLRFNVLQLSRFIPMGQDTMNLVPDSLVFYIDDTTQTGSSCIDCDLFDAGGTYTTILKINAGINDISKYFIGTSLADNEYRYAFTSYYDSIANTYSGNLHDFASLISYTNNTFTGFLPSQHYRLRVFYSVCGNFSGGASSDAADFVKPSQITNRMFLSGNIHQAVSNTIPQQPNTVALLDSAGWTVNPNDLSNVLADTNFMNQYAFFCEATGAIHYFASTETGNGSFTQNTEGCKKLLRLRATSNITGGKDIYDAFPYEYKTPQLMPVHFEVNIPTGYYVSSAWVSNTINFPSGTSAYSVSDTVGIHLADTVDKIVITDADLPPLHCFKQTQTQAGKDSLFFGDQYNMRSIDLQLMPLPQSCIDTLVKPATDSTCVISFNIQTPSCLQSGACTQVNFSKGNGQMQALGVNPDLILSGTSNSLVLLNSDTVCWHGIKIENQSNTQPALTQADNVFLALIDSSPNYLYDWHFVKSGQVIYPDGNIFGLTSALATGTSITGDLCARVQACPADTLPYEVRLHYGWNCGGYPPSPYDSTQICEYASLNLSFEKAGYSLQSPGKWYETPYTLCDTVTLSAEFKSTELGYVYPDSVELQNLDPGLQILSVSITGTGAAVPLMPTSQPQVWLIGPSAMAAAGFSGGGFNNGAAFTLRVEFIPSCTFAGDTTLPDIVIFAHNFCNDSVSANANKTMMSTFRMSSVQSNCTDCWSITKTADADTAAAVTDTVTYTITVCNNSANAQTGVLSDMMQGGFVMTATTLAGSVTLNPMQCDTFTVSGYFTQYGSCFYNVATVTSPANTTWQDSVCVNVTYPCTDSTTLIIPANTYSTTLDYRYDTLNIYIAGTLYVNDTLKLMRCTVYMDAQAQITVMNGGYLDIDSSTVTGCTNMWRGITVEDFGEVKIHEGSLIADGDTTILAKNKSKVNIDNAHFRNFVLGVYIPPKAGTFYNGTTLTVQQATFEFNAFKPDYAGQNPHGSKSQCGVMLSDWIGTIGGGTQFMELNYFNNLNTGIVGIGSMLTIKRSCFKNINYDNFYNEPYRGTAITNIKNSNSNTTTLRVLPEVWNYITVDSSYRGIYANGSELTVNYIHLLNVRTGVESKNSPLLSTNMVTNCTITATHSGIFWNYNPLARFMYANDNNITINGTSQGGGFFSVVNSGIYMSEFSNGFVQYTASGNTIHTNNAGFGIYAGALTNAKIKYNDIGMTGSGTGISVNKNINASVSCNTVRGNYAGSSQASAGIAVNNSSNKTTMYCNTADSTYRGFFFGGACPNTVLKGNEMTNHFNGLYLNNGGTYIGTQPNHGNKWNGTFGSFGAVNAAAQPLWQLSAFTVSPLSGAAYNPVVSPSTGWFFPDTTGSTFYCYSSIVCSSLPPALVDSALNAMIANGEIEPEEYVAETKAIAEEYLYRELADDSALRFSDSTYIQFMLEKGFENTAYLYDAEEYLRAAYSIDTFYMSLVDSCNLQITILTDSIEKLNEEGLTDLIEQAIYTIDFLNQTINNLYIQREATLNNNLENAELQNEYVTNGELPEINAALMNEIEINYLESGGNIEILQNNYSNIYSVAMQCPYSGGGAVERARSLISFINDSVIYNDDLVCLQNGVYRFANDSINTQELNKIIVQPNPTNDKVEILLIGNFKNGLCEIEIKNLLGEVVKSDVMNCNDKQKAIDVSGLARGVYSINVSVQDIQNLTTKLVIIK